MRIAVISNSTLETSEFTTGGIERSAYNFARTTALQLDRIIDIYSTISPRKHNNTLSYNKADAPRNIEEYDIFWCFSKMQVKWLTKNAYNHPEKLFVFEHNYPTPPDFPNLKNILHITMSSHIDKILKVKGSSTSLSPPILFGKEITYSPSCRGYILWLARTHKDKNPDALIEFAKHSKLPIYVMGHLSLDYNLNNENIITLGQMVGLRKREILSNATALLYTVDPDWNEAGGIAISEALACGVPVLGQLSKTKSPLSDKVRNGIDGFVSKSPKELALKVEEVKDLNRQNIRSHWWPKLNPKSVIKSRLKVATSLFIENKGN